MKFASTQIDCLNLNRSSRYLPEHAPPSCLHPALGLGRAGRDRRQQEAAASAMAAAGAGGRHGGTACQMLDLVHASLTVAQQLADTTQQQ